MSGFKDQDVGNIASYIERLELENMDLRQRLSLFADMRRVVELLSALPPMGKDEEE